MDVIYRSSLLNVERVREPLGLRLVGDVDSFTVSIVASALRALLTEGRDIHLELSGLQFMDVAGLELLVSTAGEMGDGRNLVLHALSPHLWHIMELVGWDSAPGLLLVEE